MANPASTSSPFSITLPHTLQEDDVVLDRLSSASQSKIYPSKCSRTEIPLRRILLVTRLWNEVRHYQTMRSSFASQQRYDMDFGHGDWNPPSPPPQQAQQQAQQSKSAEVPVVLDDEFALSLLPADLVEVDMGHVVDWDEEIEDESSSSEEEEANARKRRDSGHEEDKDRRASKRRKDQSVPPFEADDSTPSSAGPILSDSLSAATSPVISPA